MDAWVYYSTGVGVALVFTVAGLVCLVLWGRDRRLEAELAAYVAEGTMPADTARQILAARAGTGRKREVAALIAEGMAPADGLSLLGPVATT